VQLINCAIKMNWITKETQWSGGFPTPSNIDVYADNLADLLINRIGFARGNNNFKSKLKSYSEKTFKPSVGLE